MYKVKLRQRRIFSEEFKRARVKEYESGKLRPLEIARAYDVHFQTVYNWIYKYSNYNKNGSIVVVEMKSQTNKNKQLTEKIKELERIIGRKQMNIDYLEKLIELSESEFNIVIKKKDAASPSTGSYRTDQSTDGK